ncbi:hypothetical protein LCGC14_0364330 [marine sediment metagenome]|uniref:DNA-directed DNA polymerase family A palm domain-containing protein n=1 Tax=marine sediment metagenome TaxID=412755 RepID=A0A0F9TQ65_9ZZZZ
MSLVKPKPIVGLDTEVQNEPDVWCVGIADNKRRTASQDLETFPLREVMPVFHNAKYDVPRLARAGVKYDDWHDTIIEAHLLGYKPLNLPFLSETFNGVHLDKTFVKERKTKTFDQRPQETLEGCSLDAWASYQLHQQWYPELEHRGLIPLYEKEKKVTRVLWEMENRGLPLDEGRVKIAARNLIQSMGRLEITLRRYGIENPNDKTLIGQKFWRGKGRVKTTKTGQLATGKDILKAYRKPEEVEWTDAVIEWRALDKLKSTYLNKYLGLERLHPNFNQTGTISWRFSCSDPNLQNVPKSKTMPLYQLFVAPEGWTFISADYSQLELRHLANISRDKAMLDAYLRGDDLHQDALDNTPILRKMYETGDPFLMDKARRWAKVRNFGIAYGITAIGLAPKMEVEIEEAEEFIQDWYRRYPDVLPWQALQVAHAEEFGYVLTGEDRPLYVPGIHLERGRLRGHAENQCINLPVQGGGAEIVKDAMLRCNEYLVCQVHDELLYLVPTHLAEEYEKYLFEALADDRYEVPYPVEIHVGASWGDIKHIPEVMFDDDDEEE